MRASFADPLSVFSSDVVGVSSVVSVEVPVDEASAEDSDAVVVSFGAGCGAAFNVTDLTIPGAAVASWSMPLGEWVTSPASSAVLPVDVG